MSDDGLTVLLIEDNPGDVRLIEEMLRDAGELYPRVDAAPDADGSITVLREETLADGVDRLATTDVDVVLLDLGLPDSTGLDTLSTVADATEFLPIVVLTGLRDEEVGIEAVQRGAQDCLVKDEVTSALLVRTVHHAIERNRQERARARHVEQLEAINRLDRISQEITHDLIGTSTREDLERAVCDRLAGEDGYRFAWLGQVDRASGRVVPRASAGAGDGYLDEVTVSAGTDGATAEGPTGRAVRTQSVQVERDLAASEGYDPWREPALERGYRSSAAVPVVYRDVIYGVLNVYSESAASFSDPERDILARLGDVVGHAITAVERKEALVSDTVLELEFEVGDVGGPLVALPADADATIDVHHMVRKDDELVAYGRAVGVAADELEAVAERDEALRDLRILSEGEREATFELLTDRGTELADGVAAHGGHLDGARIDDGGLRFVVAFPPGRDKRQLVELVEGYCPAASHYGQRTVERSDRDVADLRSVLRDRLTEKQRTALEVAHFAGFFQWPRESTGQEVADRLGVTPATFSQHLRAAERKFFDAVFGSAADQWDDDADARQSG